MPPAGFAVGHRSSVILVGVHGDELERLRGYQIAGNSDNSGVWLQQARHYFRLDADHGTLVPVRRSLARERIYGGGSEPDLPIPPGGRYRGMTVGRWNYVIPGPAGRTLAQWSGECEVPTAFWVEGTKPVVLTTGQEKLSGPASIALGWGSDGSAYAYVGEGYCGGRGSPPGIYAFTAPAQARLVYKTPPGAYVDMW
ncbi:MAG: hypothetical protein M3N53_12535 [Actinomycetota bacterium]|nr:hypothetical protein [Actinomycetota bacterium]